MTRQLRVDPYILRASLRDVLNLADWRRRDPGNLRSTEVAHIARAAMPPWTRPEDPNRFDVLYNPPAAGTFRRFLQARRASFGTCQASWSDVETELDRRYGFMACAWHLTLSDGASEMASGGYLDGNDIPPWDTWLTEVDHALIAWVPTWARDALDAALAANPVDCIGWIHWDRSTLHARQMIGTAGV